MSITLSWGLIHYHLVTKGEEFACGRANATHSTLDFLDPSQAESFLKRFRDDTAAMVQLRRFVSELAPSSSGALKDAEALAELAKQLPVKRVSIIKCELPVTGGARPQAPPPPPRKEKAAPPPVAKHWIEFRVIEEKTQRPVAEMTLKVRLPGRGEEEHTTAARDVHIDLAASGVADLLEMTHLDVWEAVDIQSG